MLFLLVMPRKRVLLLHMAVAPALVPPSSILVLAKPSHKNHRKCLLEKDELMESSDWVGFCWGHTSLVSYSIKHN